MVLYDWISIFFEKNFRLFLWGFYLSTIKPICSNKSLESSNIGIIKRHRSSFLALLHLLELLPLLILQQLNGVATRKHTSHLILSKHALTKISHTILYLLTLHLYNFGHILIDNLALLHKNNDSHLHLLKDSRYLRIIEQS